MSSFDMDHEEHYNRARAVLTLSSVIIDSRYLPSLQSALEDTSDHVAAMRAQYQKLEDDFTVYRQQHPRITP